MRALFTKKNLLLSLNKCSISILLDVKKQVKLKIHKLFKRTFVLWRSREMYKAQFFNALLIIKTVFTYQSVFKRKSSFLRLQIHHGHMKSIERTRRSLGIPINYLIRQILQKKWTFFADLSEKWFWLLWCVSRSDANKLASHATETRKAWLAASLQLKVAFCCKSLPIRDIQWVISSNISSQKASENTSLFLFTNDRKGSRNPDEWNLDPNTSWFRKLVPRSCPIFISFSFTFWRPILTTCMSCEV